MTPRPRDCRRPGGTLRNDRENYGDAGLRPARSKKMLRAKGARVSTPVENRPPFGQFQPCSSVGTLPRSRPLSRWLSPLSETTDTWVDQAIDHRRGHCGVAEDLAPAPERLVGSDDHRRSFIAGRHELEEQVGGLGAPRRPQPRPLQWPPGQIRCPPAGKFSGRPWAVPDVP